MSWLETLVGQVPEEVRRILFAMLVGGVIGAEREYREKSAGFRTMIFICAGAALFTIFSNMLAQPGDSDRTRIAAQIVAGVGFLGAGVILREGGQITGLTTAAAIWITAALGMGIGGGAYGVVLCATAAVLAVLWGFPWIERAIDFTRETRIYEVVCPLNEATFRRLVAMIRQHQLMLRSQKQMKRGDRMICVWGVRGRPRRHDRFVQQLFADPEVLELRF